MAEKNIQQEINEHINIEKYDLQSIRENNKGENVYCINIPNPV